MEINKLAIIRIAIVINIVLFAVYYTPPIISYLHTRRVAKKFEKLNLKYYENTFKDRNYDIVKLYDYDVEFKTNLEKGHGFVPLEKYELYIFVNGELVNKDVFTGEFDKHYTSSINILNLDKDKYEEVYFFKFNNKMEYNVLDFYESDNKIKYELKKLKSSTFIGKHFDSYKFNFFKESISAVFLLFTSFILTIVHVVILIIIGLFFLIRYLKKRKEE